MLLTDRLEVCGEHEGGDTHLYKYQAAEMLMRLKRDV